jgi:hypothetical protein
MAVQKTITKTGAIVLSLSISAGTFVPSLAVAQEDVKDALANENGITETVDEPLALMSDSEAFALAQRTTGISFKDLKKDHWAWEAVQNAVQKGYFEGYKDGTFKPSAPVTRQEFAVLLDRVSTNKVEGNGHTFADAAGRWSSEGISGAVQKGFLNPSDFSGNNFKPAQQLTRIELVRWMVAGLGKGDSDFTKAVEDSKETVLPIAEYYKGGLSKSDYGTVAVGLGTGLINGFKDGTFGGNKTTTRAEVASLLLRFEKVQKQKAVDFKKLNELREIGLTGTNALTMGYRWRDENTFQSLVKDKEITMKDGWGKLKMSHALIIDPNEKDGLFYDWFFGEGSNLQTRAVPRKGNLLAILNNVTVSKTGFNTDILKTATDNDMLGMGGYTTGTEDKYGIPTLPRDVFGDLIKFDLGKTKTFYDVSEIESPAYFKFTGDVSYGKFFYGNDNSKNANLFWNADKK